MTTNDQIWPARPDHWPEVMSEIELCQYLKLDIGRTVAGARRSLRYIRSKRGLQGTRAGRSVIFRKTTVDAWMAAQEALQTPAPPGVTK